VAGRGSIDRAYFTYSATAEERFMAGRFPEFYPEYKHSTKDADPLRLLSARGDQRPGWPAARVSSDRTA
jgi:hypothetical protein